MAGTSGSVVSPAHAATKMSTWSMAKFREIDNLRASLYVYVMMSGLFYRLLVSTQPFPPSTATLGLAFYIGNPATEFNHQIVDARMKIENR
jgi:hypothetical protein